MSPQKNFEFEIIEHYGVIAEKNKGWKKELNSVSWAGAEPKYDIREWSPEHDKMGKGITFTENELINLSELLKEMFDGDINSFINSLTGIKIEE